MYTQDNFGEPLHVLPDCAFCNAEGKRLEDFEICPERKFNEFGDVCVPGLCENYEEDWAEKLTRKEE